MILEELRKRSEGYVATLSGVQAGRVSKLCVCVRNTGSRAAFVKAVPYSSLQNRAVMDSTVISLSPSQFVLKERTQEVSQVHVCFFLFVFFKIHLYMLGRFISAVSAGDHNSDEGFTQRAGSLSVWCSSSCHCLPLLWGRGLSTTVQEVSGSSHLT